MSILELQISDRVWFYRVKVAKQAVAEAERKILAARSQQDRTRAERKILAARSQQDRTRAERNLLDKHRALAEARAWRP